MTDQFSGNGGHDHVSMFAALHQRSIPSTESDLSIPGFLHNGLGQVFLALLQDPGGFGRVSIGMGGLNQHASRPFVAGTGQWPDPTAAATGSFAGR